MSLHVHIAAMVKLAEGEGALMEEKEMQKGTQWVSSVMSSLLQFDLKRIGAPFACVTVEHGALCEGHITLCVYQDD